MCINKNKYLLLYLEFRPDIAPGQPVSLKTRLLIAHSFQLLHRHRHVVRAPEKALIMTVNLDKYRHCIAPLALSAEEEDRLLADLWRLSQSLVDLVISAPSYPLQIRQASAVFGAVAEPAAIESNLETDNKEESCP